MFLQAVCVLTSAGVWGAKEGSQVTFCISFFFPVSLSFFSSSFFFLVVDFVIH